MIRPPHVASSGGVAVRDDRDHVSGGVGGHADDTGALDRHEDRRCRQGCNRGDGHIKARRQVADEQAAPIGGRRCAHRVGGARTAGRARGRRRVRPTLCEK